MAQRWKNPLCYGSIEKAFESPPSRQILGLLLQNRLLLDRDWRTFNNWYLMTHLTMTYWKLREMKGKATRLLLALLFF